MLSPLQNKLAGLRNKVRLILAMSGLARTVVVLLGLAAVTYLLDRWLGLPAAVRGVLLVFCIGTLIVVIHRALWAPLGRQLDDLDLAAGVEARYPDMADRIRSALDFERAMQADRFHESRVLAEQVVSETVQTIGPLDFREVARSRRALPWLAAAGTALALAVVGLTLAGADAMVWFQRSILIRSDVVWPRSTSLIVLMPPEGSPVYVTQEDGHTVFNLAQGLDLTLNVIAERGDPNEVTLHFDAIPGAAERFAGTRVLPRVQRGRYATTFERLTRSFAFHVTGGDDTDREPGYLVRVHRAPAVAAISVEAVFPAYTGRDPRVYQTGDVEVPRDSDLTIRIEATQTLTSAAILAGKRPPLAMTRIDGRRFETKLRADQDFDYSFDLVGVNRIRNHDRVRFRVVTVADRAPTIRVERPAGTLVEFATGGVMPLLALVRDDYGVKQCRLKIRKGKTARDLALAAEDRIGGDDGDVEVRRAFYLFKHLELAAVVPDPKQALTPGDVLRLAVEVEDNHENHEGAASPHVGRTKEIKIELLKKSDLERRVNDRQLRVKDEVRKARAYLERTLGDTTDLVAVLAASGAGDGKDLDLSEVAEQILTSERRQNRLTADLRSILRELSQNLDTYVYNRLENTPDTTRVLDIFARETRRQPGDALARFRVVVASAREGTVGGSDVLSKLVTMVGLALDATEEASPAAARALNTARSAGRRVSMHDHLRTAVQHQTRCLGLLGALIQGLEEWEDYQEVIQLTKELIELQKEIESRTKTLIKKSFENKSRER